MFLGYLFAPYISAALNPMVDSFRDRVQSGDIKLTYDSIFFNNVYVGIMLYCGAIVFGLSTASILIINGLFIGYYATQIQLDSFLLLTLPHGIIEIPTIIITGASGFIMFKFLIEFFHDIINPKISKDQTQNINIKLGIKNRIINSTNGHADKITQSLSLLGLSVVLLLIAAFIEAYLTIPIANFFAQFLGYY